MKINFILSVLLFPVLAFSQKTETFLRVTDGNNTQIAGTATQKGYENTIIVTSLQSDAATPVSGGKMSTRLTITIPVSGAAADFKRSLASGKPLLKGDFVTLTAPNAIISGTIRIENITVLSCTDAIGCDGIMNTTIQLNAVRIGWTYYTIDRSGKSIVSRKFGWDAQMNREWTGF